MPGYDIDSCPSREEVVKSLSRSQEIVLGIKLFGGVEHGEFRVKLAACTYSWKGENELQFEGWGTYGSAPHRVEGVLRFFAKSKGYLHF